MPVTIALVDDDRNILTSVSIALQAEGFATRVYSDGEAALKALVDNPPDLAVLDVKMPKMDGMELLRRLREKSELPVIFLTSKDVDIDEALGLAMGADDYVAKPFSQRLLIARIRAVLRRARPAPADEMLRYEDISMDLAAHRVRRAGRELHLGPTEFRLLRFLMENPGRVFSREQLLDRVWGREVYVEPRTVDVHIRRLRKAINGPKERDLVRTVRSAGYALDAEKG